MNTTEKDYVIFSQKLAGFLMMNSCRLKKIKNANDDPRKFVYFFNNNEEVKSLVAKYKSMN